LSAGTLFERLNAVQRGTVAKQMRPLKAGCRYRVAFGGVMVDTEGVARIS
jgi:hypothetical protein